MPTKRIKHLFLYCFFFSLFPSTVVDNLKTLCLSYQQLENKYQEFLSKQIQDTQPMTNQKPTSRIVSNSRPSLAAERNFYSDFATSITTSPNMIGYGSYGAVYQMADTHQLGESRDRSIAVKLIRVGENTRISRIKKN